MPAIVVEELRKSYGSLHAVRGVSFSVEPGEVFGLLGPNGAGKTTIVEILEGYRHRDSGRVEVLGADPATAGRDLRRRVGMVLQECAVEPYLTVREVVDLHRGYYPKPLPTDDVVELVGLEEKAGVRVKKLSGGQQRRLDLALALIGAPELVFLDEPTTGFDPSARRHAWEVLATLRTLGKTIFLTTHYMDEAQVLADRVAVIVAGEIVAEGTPETLGGRDEAIGDVSFSLPPGAVLSGLPAELVPIAQLRDGRVHIAAREPARVLYALAGWALARDDDLRDLTVGRPTPEDI